MRMRAAPVAFAVMSRFATSVSWGWEKGAVGASSASQWSRWRSCMRSASGFTASRDRSNTAYLLAIGKEGGKQFAPAEKIRNDEVRSHACEALAFPLVDNLALRLGGGDSYG